MINPGNQYNHKDLFPEKTKHHEEYGQRNKH